MEQAITNSTVLILLAKVGRLDLLDVFKSIYTTSLIRAEILEGKELPLAEKNELQEYFTQKIKIENPKRNIFLNIGTGETSALSLCLEKKITCFLSDDKKARKAADSLSIQAVGAIGIILRNIQQRKIHKQEAKNILQKLVISSYYISTDTYAKALELIEKS